VQPPHSCKPGSGSDVRTRFDIMKTKVGIHSPCIDPFTCNSRSCPCTHSSPQAYYSNRPPPRPLYALRSANKHRVRTNSRRIPVCLLGRSVARQLVTKVTTGGQQRCCWLLRVTVNEGCCRLLLLLLLRVFSRSFVCSFVRSFVVVLSSLFLRRRRSAVVVGTVVVVVVVVVAFCIAEEGAVTTTFFVLSCIISSSSSSSSSSSLCALLLVVFAYRDTLSILNNGLFICKSTAECLWVAHCVVEQEFEDSPDGG